AGPGGVAGGECGGGGSDGGGPAGGGVGAGGAVAVLPTFTATTPSRGVGWSWRPDRAPRCCPIPRWSQPAMTDTTTNPFHLAHRVVLHRDDRDGYQPVGCCGGAGP